MASTVGNASSSTYVHCADALLHLDTIEKSVGDIHERKSQNLHSGFVPSPEVFRREDEPSGKDSTACTPESVVKRSQSRFVSIDPQRLLSCSASTSEQAPSVDVVTQLGIDAAASRPGQGTGTPLVHEPAPFDLSTNESKLEQNCLALSFYLQFCSSNIFNKMREDMKADMRSCSLPNLPKDLLGKATFDMRAFLVKALCDWCAKDKVSVARFLFSQKKYILFAQLGDLSQVCVLIFICLLEKPIFHSHMRGFKCLKLVMKLFLHTLRSLCVLLSQFRYKVTLDALEV